MRMTWVPGRRKDAKKTRRSVLDAVAITVGSADATSGSAAVEGRIWTAITFAGAAETGCVEANEARRAAEGPVASSARLSSLSHHDHDPEPIVVIIYI